MPLRTGTKAWNLAMMNLLGIDEAGGENFLAGVKALVERRERERILFEILSNVETNALLSAVRGSGLDAETTAPILEEMGISRGPSY